MLHFNHMMYSYLRHCKEHYLAVRTLFLIMHKPVWLQQCSSLRWDGYIYI